MSSPDLRERLASYLPFVVVAVVGQVSAAWPPGPADPRLYGASSLLLFMPVVGVALYGKRWESMVSVVFMLAAILAVTIASSQLGATTLRRLFLTAAIAAMLSVAIHVIRGRLEESKARTERMLRHEKALNGAARQLAQLSEPPQITALGAQLALGIASPNGSEILRASYFRIEDGIVVVDAQFDNVGMVVEECW